MGYSELIGGRGGDNHDHTLGLGHSGTVVLPSPSSAIMGEIGSSSKGERASQSLKREEEEEEEEEGRRGTARRSRPSLVSVHPSVRPSSTPAPDPSSFRAFLRPFAVARPPRGYLFVRNYAPTAPAAVTVTASAIGSNAATLDRRPSVVQLQRAAQRPQRRSIPAPRSLSFHSIPF